MSDSLNKIKNNNIVNAIQVDYLKPCLMGLLFIMIVSYGSPSWGLDSVALPTGGQVTSGTASISTSGNSMTINQTTDRMIAEWDSFNIGSSASVTFNQPGASSVALNRISDQNASQILGSLTANGQVFLLNPSGVIFGSIATVDVGGLVTSTLDISDTDFLSGNYTFTGSTGSITNNGTINGGYVAFISPEVINNGAITADNGAVLMAAGDRVSLDFTGDGLVSYTVDKGAIDALVENKGLIQADGGTVIMTAEAADDLTSAVVNNTGVIQARTLNNVEGRILLLSDMETGETIVCGTLDASAPNGGDGGFIETSAATVTVADDHYVTTLAAAGDTGEWLIDPLNYTIAASGGDRTGASITADLATTNVTIETDASSGSEDGDIFVNDSITWSKNTLTLSAYRNIEINSELYGSDTAGLALYYGQGATDGVISGTTATYSVNAPVNLDSTGSFSTRLGTSGTVKDYTIITSLGAEGSTTGTDLQGINGALSGNYVLGADIDASDTDTWNLTSGTYYGFNPIGAFSGVFDGLGHTITDLYINRSSTDGVGLFGYVIGGSISNVGLTDVSITGKDNVGGLVGYNESSSITSSYATGDVAGGGTSSQYTGGLVGYNWYASITNSYATADVTGATHSKYIGGLVGYNEYSSITNSYATGKVAGGEYFDPEYIGGLVGCNYYSNVTNSYATGDVWGGYHVGGLVGNNTFSSITNSYATGKVAGVNYNPYYVGGLVGENYHSSIMNSYATGDVTGTDYIGGLVGFNEYSCSITNSYATGDVTGGYSVGGLVGFSYNYSSITNSYATGKITGSSSVGGLVGYDDGTGSVTDSFWDRETTGQSTSAGSDDSCGLTTEEMKSLSTYSTWSIDDEGGTSSLWRIYDGYTYPLLRSFLKSATATAGSFTKVYDGTTATLTSGSYTWSSGVDTGYIYGTATYTVASTRKDVGTYAVSLSGLYSDQNGYDIITVGGSFTITPRALIISGITASDKTYDGITAATVDASAVVYSGLVSGDDLTVSATGVFSDKNAGTGKTVTISSSYTGADADNYTITDQDSTIATIYRTTLTITAADDSKPYDGSAYSGGNGVTYSGFVGGEDASVLSGSLSYGGASQGAVNAGTYAISISGLSSGNYEIVYVDGELVIDPVSPDMSSWIIGAIEADLFGFKSRFNGTAQDLGIAGNDLRTVQWMGPGTGSLTLDEFGKTEPAGLTGEDDEE